MPISKKFSGSRSKTQNVDQNQPLSLSPECKIVPFKKGFKTLLVGLGHIVYKKGIKRTARRHKQMKSLQPSTN